MTTRPNAGRAIPHRAVLAALFVTYVITRYPDVGGRINMGDSAKFQFLARTLGIGHSPGNPLYLMATALWVRIPMGLSDATKITLFSAAAGIATVAIIARAVGTLGIAPVIERPFVLEARSFAAILLGLGSLFWTLSTEAEVYTLGSIFVAGAVLGIARWTTSTPSTPSTRRDARGLLLAVGCVGLGLGNHLTIVALAPALLYVVLHEEERRQNLRSVRLWGVAIGALAAGALSYGWIAWRAKNAPLAYSEFPGAYEWSTFVQFATGRGVMTGTFVRPTYATVVLERLPDLFAQLQKQWSWPLLSFLPIGFVRLFEAHRRFATFLALAVLGHFAIALVFRVPDPEGLFVPVSVLLVVPLALAPAGLVSLGAMTVLHAALVIAHVATWYAHPFSAYIQQTPEGKVIVNLPTLHEVVPEHAMIGVPCGHYGCVEITTYYALVDEELRAKDVSFVRFEWSEWDEGKFSVPLVDPRQRRTRPICVLLANDLNKLRERGFQPTAIARAPVKVRGLRFTSAPLHCIYP